MSLINEALKRADANKGPRRPAPLGPPPAPASPGKAAFAPPLAPAVALRREGNRWRALQAAVLGGALIIVAVAGALIWKMVGNSPAQLIAAPTTPATLSSTIAAAPATPARAADSDKARGSLMLRPAASAQGQPKSSDPLLTTANLTDSARDAFASPTLFLDARKSQVAAVGGDLPLTPTENRLATLDAASPARPPSAFATPAAGSPQPATPAAAPVASAPAAPPAQAAAPAAEAPKLKVTSIVYNSKAPTAIINGQVVGVGEVLEGAKIVAIAPRSVEVLVDGRRLTLRL
jgi:hypothetical protein